MIIRILVCIGPNKDIILDDSLNDALQKHMTTVRLDRDHKIRAKEKERKFIPSPKVS